MKPLNSNFDIQVEVLSPLHIGTSEEHQWVRGIDFVHHNGEIFVLDKNRLFADLDDHNQERYVSLISGAKFMDLEHFITSVIDPEEYKKVVFGYQGKLPSNQIKTLIRGGEGKAYIPGSSIKGAMASAVIHYLQENVGYYGKGDDISQKLLGSFEKSVFRYIRPYDGSCDMTELCDIELFNLKSRGKDWYSTYKERFMITIENFAPGAKGNFRLTIADGFGSLVRELKPDTLPPNYERIIKQNPLRFLFKVINDFTRTHIKREIEFFSKFDQAEDVDLILENLESWQKLTDEGPDTCVLRMAGGIGFHGITGDWRFEEHISVVEKRDSKNPVYNFNTRQREPARYKSRKVIRANNELMGFVKFSL